jgi:hypothetical protein
LLLLNGRGEGDGLLLLAVVLGDGDGSPIVLCGAATDDGLDSIPFPFL